MGDVKTLEISGYDLDLEQVWEFSQHALDPHQKVKVILTPEAEDRILKAEKFVEKITKGKEAVYGINTGFGKFAEVKIDSEKLIELQYNIIRSHACGVGEELTRDLVFSMWILRLNVMARGHSGTRLQTVKKIISLVEKGMLACIPSRGSVGASGDLCPSAHATLGYIGEGYVTFPCGDGYKKMEAMEALQELNETPLVLGPKEGLSLINGTQLTTAMAIKACMLGKRILKHSNLSLSFSIEALRSSHEVVNAHIIDNKNQKGCMACAEEVRYWLQSPTEISQSHDDCEKIQDNYSTRCAPLVHGTMWDQLEHAKDIINREINSSTDNPLLFPDEDLSISGGNFHALYPARMCDQIASNLTTLGSIIERRIASAMSPDSSRQLPFLTKMGGLNSGFMMCHVTAAALVSEAKSLSFPASVDSIPTNDDREDHVSMGPIAGHKAVQIAELIENVVAIELLVAAQGIDFLRPMKSSPRIEAVHAKIREQVTFMEQDRFLALDIDKIRRLLEKDALCN